MSLKNPRNIVNKKVNEALIITKSRFFTQKFTFHAYPTDLANTKTIPSPSGSVHSARC